MTNNQFNEPININKSRQQLVQELAELKLAEGTLRDSGQRYRSLFEASMDGIFLTSPDGPIHDANPAACELFGMIREEF